MRRTIGILALAWLSSPAAASSYYLSPDVPSLLGGTTYVPPDVARSDAGVYSPVLSLPAGAAIDALHRRDDGRWLLSFNAPVQLGAAVYDPRDVVLFDGVSASLFLDGAAAGIPAGVDLDAVFLVGGDGGDPVISVDVPATIGGLAILPADLVRVGGPTLFLDSTATAPPIPVSSNVTGADLRNNQLILTFDVPTTLLAGTYLPGELVSWDGVTFASHFVDPAWPPASRVDALSFLADPGEVFLLELARSALTLGDLTISWSHGCSEGAEDYVIYEGTIGDWYSHTRIDCSDDGADFTEEVTPAAGDTYYLLVPVNLNDEGSYGLASSGIPRPVGTATCVANQALSTCP